MSPAGFRKSALVALMLGTAAIAGCSPIESTHGYVPVDEAVAAIQAGKDNRDSILQVLGEPSVRSFNGDGSWYYISYRTETLGFFARKVVERQIIAIVFDNAARVARIDRYGLEDGRVIDLNTRETVSGGRKLTFFQQLLGNVGNFSAESFI